MKNAREAVTVAKRALHDAVHHHDPNPRLDIEVELFTFGDVLALKVYDKDENESWVFEVGLIEPRIG